MKTILLSVLFLSSLAFGGMNEVKKEIETLIPNSTKSVKDKCGCLPKLEVKFNTFNTAELLTCAKNNLNNFSSEASSICDAESKKIDFCKVKTWSWVGNTNGKPALKYANGVGTMELFYFNNTNCQGDGPTRLIDDLFQEERKVRENSQDIDKFIPVATKSIKTICGCDAKIEVKKNTFTSGLLMACARNYVNDFSDRANRVCVDQNNKSGFCKVKTWSIIGTKEDPKMKFANGVGSIEIGLASENCTTWGPDDLVKEHVK